MKKTLLLTLLLVTSVVVGSQFATSSEYRGEHEDDDEGFFRRTTDVSMVHNATYSEECGSCHMAYPAGLLPARSWQKLMGNLDNHFGDNAELGPELTQQLTDYLVANSADQSSARRSQQIERSIKANETPLRITDTAFFRHEHGEIPTRLVKDNPKVNSFSNCNACHQKAEQGSFSERDISIAGYGRWDD